MSTKLPVVLDTDTARLVDRLLRRLHAGLNATACDFDRHKVGPVGGMVLLTLAEIEPARIQDLVVATARDKSQMTRLVQTLEGKGLVERQEDPADARSSILALTSAGRNTVAELEQALARVLDEVLSPLTEAESESFKEILRKI